MGESDGTEVEVDLPGVGPVWVDRYSPLVDLPNDEPLSNWYREAVDEGRMDISLGPLGDLLWLYVPEARPTLATMVKAEVDRALAEDWLLAPLEPYTIARFFLHAILLPAFDQLPGSEGLIRRCFAVCRRIYAKDVDPMFAEVLDIGVFSRLIPRVGEDAIRRIDPTLLEDLGGF